MCDVILEATRRLLGEGSICVSGEIVLRNYHFLQSKYVARPLSGEQVVVAVEASEGSSFTSAAA